VTSSRPRSAAARRGLARRGLAAALLSGSLLVLVPVAPAGAATAPGPWASSVCGALNAWVGQVRTAADRAAAAKPASAKAVKQHLNTLLAQTLKNTATLRARLTKAGQPGVPGGKQIAATMREGFRQVESTLKEAKRSLKRTSTADATQFAAAAHTTQDSIEAGLEGIQSAFSAARDADASALVKAFRTQAACKAVSD
jgi:hypothetical protein